MTRDILGPWPSRVAAAIAVAAHLACGGSGRTDADVPPPVDADSDSDSHDVPVPCEPSGPETCNGVDDDCNGIVDDGVLGITAGPVELGGVRTSNFLATAGDNDLFVAWDAFEEDETSLGVRCLTMPDDLDPAAVPFPCGVEPPPGGNWEWVVGAVGIPGGFVVLLRVVPSGMGEDGRPPAGTYMKVLAGDEIGPPILMVEDMSFMRPVWGATRLAASYLRVETGSGFSEAGSTRYASFGVGEFDLAGAMTAWSWVYGPVEHGLVSGGGYAALGNDGERLVFAASYDTDVTVAGDPLVLRDKVAASDDDWGAGGLFSARDLGVSADGVGVLGPLWLRGRDLLLPFTYVGPDWAGSAPPTVGVARFAYDPGGVPTFVASRPSVALGWGRLLRGRDYSLLVAVDVTNPGAPEREWFIRPVVYSFRDPEDLLGATAPTLVLPTFRRKPDLPSGGVLADGSFVVAYNDWESVVTSGGGFRLESTAVAVRIGCLE